MKQTNFLKGVGIILISLGTIQVFMFLMRFAEDLTEFDRLKLITFCLIASVIQIYIGWNVFKKTAKAWLYAIIFLIVFVGISIIASEEESLHRRILFLSLLFLLFLIPFLYLGRHEILEEKDTQKVFLKSKGSLLMVMGIFSMLCPFLILIVLDLTMKGVEGMGFIVIIPFMLLPLTLITMPLGIWLLLKGYKLKKSYFLKRVEKE